MWPCPRLAIRPDAAQGEVTLMCPDTSAVHHPPSTEWAPMRREWPPAAAFLSDRAGIALAALDPCVHSQGMPQLGAVSPKPAQPLYWSQSPWLWPLTHCQGSWPAWPWDESLWGKCLALDPWYLTVSRLVGWLINLLLSLNQYFPTEAFLGSLSLSLKTNLFYLMCMSALPVCMYVYYMCVCMCTACVPGVQETSRSRNWIPGTGATQRVVSYYVGAENGTMMQRPLLCKSIKCSYSLDSSLQRCEHLSFLLDEII